MVFVPGYGHDVFISYAHVNDLPPPAQPQFATETRPGWVAMLVWHLTIALAQKIGRLEAFHIWFDQKDLRGNYRLTGEIADELKRSATLVAVRSPGYLASVWCQDETRLFARHFKEQLKNRIFVVDKDPLDADAEPLAELEGHPDRYRFWDRDHLTGLQVLAFPMSPQDEVKYSRRVRNLADDLYAQLKAMGGKLPRAERDASAPLTGTPAARRQDRAAMRRPLVARPGRWSFSTQNRATTVLPMKSAAASATARSGSSHCSTVRPTRCARISNRT